MTLSDAKLAALARLWGEIAEEGATTPGAYAEAVIDRLGTMLAGSHGFVILGRKKSGRADRHVPQIRIHHGPERQVRERVIRDWVVNDDWEGDPHVQGMMRRLGEPRAYLRRQLADGVAWDRSATRRLLDELGVGDRLVAGIGLTPELELFVGIDRDRCERPFGEAERSLMAIAIAGLAPSAKQVARATGLVDALAPLSAREQQVLKHLLRGCAEKEVAYVLGLSAGYVHQIVVRIYRKLGARSRGELLARFAS